jgi:hypothetical protein
VPTVDLDLELESGLADLVEAGGGGHGDASDEPVAEVRVQMGLQLVRDGVGCADREVLEAPFLQDVERDLRSVAAVLRRELVDVMALAVVALVVLPRVVVRGSSSNSSGGR